MTLEPMSHSIIAPFRRIHLIGICGTAMASLAGMLRTRGFEVTGSDQNIYPPMSTFLDEMGISLFLGFSEQHIAEARPDLVVVGNAISRGNAEVEFALDQKIRYSSLPEILKELFVRGHQSIVVAGTHGKTTTTSLVAWLFEHAGLDPSFLIGGIAENFGSSFKLGQGDFFIIEGDEYDTAFFDKGPKFLHYLPDWVIFNNCEYDHADIYPDVASVQTSFRRLINMIPRNGRLFSGWDDLTVRELSGKAFCPVISYGLEDSPVWKADSIDFGEESTRFVAWKGGRKWAAVEISLSGAFNVKNALAAIACAEAAGIPLATVEEGLRRFRNVKRRLEIRGVFRGVTVFDDFAHHPTAIRETLTAVRTRFPQNRVWAIYEPRSATSRRNVFQKELSASFGAADMIILCSPFAPQKLDPAILLDVEEVIRSLRRGGKNAEHYCSAQEILDEVVPRLQAGDKVVIMSNGGFDDIHRKMLEALRRG